MDWQTYYDNLLPEDFEKSFDKERDPDFDVWIQAKADDYLVYEELEDVC